MTLTSNTPNETSSAPASAEWSVDPAHSHVGFDVRHLMIATVRGELQTVEGTVWWDPNHPERSRIEVDIDVASVNTRDPKRDAHLRSADFFDAEKHPKMTYRSHAVGRRKDGTIEVVGDLTIRGVTRVVVLDVEGPTPEQKDPWGGVRIAASARATIKRSEYGMMWNAALEAGGVLVGDDVNIALEVELAKKG